VTGLPGDAAFVSTGTFSATPPQAAFTDTPEHVTDKLLVWPSLGVTTATARLSFQHRYDLEEDFDGATLEISIGGGAFTDILVAGGSFASGGYDGTISLEDGSPLAGRAAWTGTSPGFVAVTVNLPASSAGQSVVVRWRVASDTLIGLAGYWLDSIELTEPGGAYTCTGTAVNCDDGITCTVDSCSPSTGCAHPPGNLGTECRASSGSACDPAEQCDGVSATCPPDAFGANSAVGNTVRVSRSGATATISWSGETAAGPFNVYRGSRPRLYDHTCWMSGVSGTSEADGDPLTVGDWVYYLVSRDTPPCFESSLGQASNGTQRPNTSPCP
jgi:hypothetical protein